MAEIASASIAIHPTRKPRKPRTQKPAPADSRADAMAAIAEIIKKRASGDS